MQRNIDGEKEKKKRTVPGREEFAPDFSTYGEKREAMKQLFRDFSEKQKEK